MEGIGEEALEAGELMYLRNWSSSVGDFANSPSCSFERGVLPLDSDLR